MLVLFFHQDASSLLTKLVIPVSQYLEEFFTFSDTPIFAPPSHFLLAIRLQILDLSRWFGNLNNVNSSRYRDFIKKFRES